jgi:excinuclease UvrABC ATPase subunit
VLLRRLSDLHAIAALQYDGGAHPNAFVNQEEGKYSLFIFDEPTTGLCYEDIAKLLNCFDALIAKGNSVLIVEHDMDVIKCADWIVDLGLEAGDEGGRFFKEIPRLTTAHIDSPKPSLTAFKLKLYFTTIIFFIAE